MIKKNLSLFILMLILLILSGCWDNRDINELSVVTAIGLDKTEDDKIEITIQMVKPDILKAIQQGSSEEAFWSISATGDTTFEALRNTMISVSNKPFFAFAEILIIGEEVARDGIMDVLDFFERDHETKKRAKILIAKGIKAKEILKAKCDVDYLNSNHIKGIIENTIALPKIIEQRLIDLLKEVSLKGKNFVIGVIEKRTDINDTSNSEEDLYIQDLKVDSSAVFKGDKLIGWLDSDETTGYLYIVNKVKNHVLNIKNPKVKNKKVAIELTEVKTNIDIKMENGSPILIIKVKVKGSIADQQGGGDLTTPDILSTIEQEVAKEIREKINKVLYITQNEYQNDVFGFGEVVHRKELKYWNTVKEDWHNLFKNLSSSLIFDVKIVRSGLTISTPDVSK